MSKVHGKRYAYKFDFAGLSAAQQQQSLQGAPSLGTRTAGDYRLHHAGDFFLTPQVYPPGSTGRKLSSMDFSSGEPIYIYIYICVLLDNVMDVRIELQDTLDCFHGSYLCCCVAFCYQQNLLTKVTILTTGGYWTSAGSTCQPYRGTPHVQYSCAM